MGKSKKSRKAKKSQRKNRRASRRHNHAGLRADSLNINNDSLRFSSVDDAFQPYEPRTLSALLAAACDSPVEGLRQRRASLLVLWIRSVANPPHGDVRASFGDLHHFLAVAHRAEPKLRHLEDFLPCDPRLEVRVSLGDRRYRVHPGDFMDPVELIQNVRMTARAIDDYTLSARGFSASDFIEGALSYGDWCLSQMIPAWSAMAVTEEEHNAWGGDAEIEGVLRRQSSSAEEWTQRCAYPERAAKAWAWATIPASSVRFCLKPMFHSIGPTLAVDGDFGIAPIPIAEVLNAVAGAVAHLAKKASSDSQSQYRLQAQTEELVHRILSLGSPVPMDPHDGPSLMGIVPGERHHFWISVATGLDYEGLNDSLRDAIHMLNSKEVAQVDDIDDTSIVLCRIIVYGGPLRLLQMWRKNAAQVHVEDFVAIIREIQMVENSDDLLWQFLLELTGNSTRTKFLAIEFLDIWRHWRTYGMLNPSPDQIIVAADPTPIDTTWQQSGELEFIERVLHDARLPETREWAWIHLDHSKGATLIDDARNICLVSVVPRLLVVIIAPWSSATAVDPAFFVGVGDGIRLTCQRDPLKEILTQKISDPVTVCLHMGNDEPMESERGTVGANVRMETPRPIIDLWLGSGWIAQLAEDPYRAHVAVGEAIAWGLTKISVLDDESARNLFIEEWRKAPPVALITFGEASLPMAFKGDFALPRTNGSAGEAQRMLMAELRRSGIKPGVYLKRDAVSVARDRLLPAMERQLRKLIEDWDSHAVEIVAEQLNAAHGERRRARKELEQALHAPWAATWRTDALQATEEAEITRPLEVLLELLVARRRVGSIKPDRFDIAPMVDMASELLRVGTAFDSGIRNLLTWRLTILELGMFYLDPGTDDGSRNLDWAAYWQADRANRRRIGTGLNPNSTVVPEYTASEEWGETAFTPLSTWENLPTRLREVDHQMRLAWGTGWDGLRAVLSTAVSWNIDEGSHPVWVPYMDLRDSAREWSGLSNEEIEAACRHLTLQSEHLHAEDIPYWEIERRAYRLAVRPLIRIGDDLLVLPWLVAAAQEIYGAYLSDGRLPSPAADMPKALQTALNQFRQMGNRQLERESADIIKEIGLPYRSNLDIHEAERAGVTIPGEIDLLVADSERSRIWVCEVKDVSAAFSPRTIRKRVDKFLDDEHYVEKLLDRSRAIQKNPVEAARLLGVKEASLPWRIIPLMITRQVEPAAFVLAIEVPFVVLDDLKSILLGDDDPGPGQVAVGESSD